MRIGILLPNWIGDAVMATPMLRAVRTQYPQSTICGIMRPIVADALAGNGWFDDLIYYDRRANQQQMGMWAVIRQIRNQRLDAILLLTNSLRSAFLAWAGNVKRRIGYARSGRSWLLTDALEPKRDGRALAPMSPVDYYLELARTIGCENLNRQLCLATRPEDERAAAEAWESWGYDCNEPVIALNTGGAYGPAKDWPAEHFVELAERLANELAAAVVIVCGPAERETAASIEQRVNHARVRSLATRPLSVGLTKACLRRSSLVISTDSGPRHLAAGLGVPVIALFGPTDPRWSENYHSLETRLFLDMACRPCAARTCPLVHHRCMRDLSVERVFQAARSVWNARRARVA